jgi:hypothetical protein
MSEPGDDPDAWRSELSHNSHCIVATTQAVLPLVTGLREAGVDWGDPDVLGGWCVQACAGAMLTLGITPADIDQAMLQACAFVSGGVDSGIPPALALQVACAVSPEAGLSLQYLEDTDICEQPDEDPVDVAWLAWTLAALHLCGFNRTRKGMVNRVWRRLSETSGERYARQACDFELDEGHGLQGAIVLGTQAVLRMAQAVTRTIGGVEILAPLAGMLDVRRLLETDWSESFGGGTSGVAEEVWLVGLEDEERPRRHSYLELDARIASLMDRSWGGRKRDAWPGLLVEGVCASCQRAVESMHQCRSEGLFDIVSQSPESDPALRDLAVALASLPPSCLIDTAVCFAKSVQRRLLQPGADTGTIITVLLSTSQCMQRLDPSGILLRSATGPVRRYIQNERPDAVKHIVSMLVSGGNDEEGDGEEESNPLRAELESQTLGLLVNPASKASHADVLQGEEDHDVGPGVGGDKEPAEKGRSLEALLEQVWSPAGHETDGQSSSRSTMRAQAVRRSLEHRWALFRRPLLEQEALPPRVTPMEGRVDLLGSLVSVLGDTSALIKSYEEWLANRLLRLESWDVDAEVYTHELLKTRFGEGPLHTAEVMVSFVSLCASRRVS